MSDDRFQGEVVRFNKQKGFGFLSGPDNVEHWFHVSGIVDRDKTGILPVPGDVFAFGLKPSPKVSGRDEAHSLVLVKRASTVAKGAR